MRKFVLQLALIVCCSINTFANDSTAVKFDDIEYKIAVGFNLGATSPLDLPAEVRAINSYSPTTNLSVAAYIHKFFSPSWGLRTGLRYEYKGMQTGINVRNYQMTVNIQDGDATGQKSGYFTGDIINKTNMGYLTIPVTALYRINHKWDIHAGWYFSYAIDSNFTGRVVQGQIRETPLQPVISIAKADYDYSDDLQKFDTGLELGAAFKVYKGLAIDANLTWGVLSVLHPAKRQMDMDNYNIYLNIGASYTF